MACLLYVMAQVQRVQILLINHYSRKPYLHILSTVEIDYKTRSLNPIGAEMEWYQKIKENDPELFGYLKGELERKRNGLELIPSENFTSEAVLQALGSILTDKYSEGYPGRRYYGGNEFIDKIETLTQERAKKLFGVP